MIKMKSITGLRDIENVGGKYKDYKISDLLNKVDCVLSEHGFASEEPIADENTGGFYQIYNGLKGKAIIRFVAKESKLIPLTICGIEASKCPVYIERIDVPSNIDISICNDLLKI